MIWIDYVFFVIVAIHAMSGFIEGISQKAYALFTGVIACVVGLGFAGDLRFLLHPILKDPSLLLPAGFLSLGLLTTIIAVCIKLLLGDFLKKHELRLWERFAGMGIGFVMGLLWTCVLVLVAGLTDLPPHAPWWKQSETIPFFQTFVQNLHKHFPSDVTNNVHFR
jgi:membrane protein required for colicin V production